MTPWFFAASHLMKLINRTTQNLYTALCSRAKIHNKRVIAINVHAFCYRSNRVVAIYAQFNCCHHISMFLFFHVSVSGHVSKCFWSVTCVQSYIPLRVGVKALNNKQRIITQVQTRAPRVTRSVAIFHSDHQATSHTLAIDSKHTVN